MTRSILCLCFTLWTLPASAQEAQGIVPFQYHERLVFLRGTLNGERDILCLLDTGASKSAVDATVGAELGLDVTRRAEVEGSAGVVEVDMVQLASLAIGGREVRDLEVTQYDLGGLLAPPEAPDARVGAIVGFDFLKDARITIDYRDHVLSWSPGSEEVDDRWVAVPLELDNGIPRFAATLEGEISADFRLDTGASIFASEDVYLNVTERVWGALTRADPDLRPTSHLSATGLGGELQLPVARIGSMTLGAIEVRDPWIIVQPEQGYFARPDAVGFVGNNFLEKYERVVIDYSAKELLLPREGEDGR